VREPLLVRDVLYACQGITGKFMDFQVRRACMHACIICRSRAVHCLQARGHCAVPGGAAGRAGL